MENEEKKEEGKSCCAKGGCCCKAFKAVGLLVIGLVGGYFAGRHCAMCSMKAAPAEVSAPAAAPAAAPAPKK
jgi:hypothetical protein